MVYGQTEITRDLMDGRAAAGAPTIYAAERRQPARHLDSERRASRTAPTAKTQRVACDFIAGCDGFHGVSRKSVPPAAIRRYERVYPFGWLGILSDTPPVRDELIYASHPARLCAVLDALADAQPLLHAVQPRRGDRGLAGRAVLGRAEAAGSTRRPRERLVTGPSIEKSIAPLRSFVAEPMRFGRLFLAGDAAHIVPPTGAKGLNLAASDVHYLSQALDRALRRANPTPGSTHYSERALARVWKAERFSWWMTTLLHRISRQPFRSQDSARRARLSVPLEGCGNRVR